MHILHTAVRMPRDKESAAAARVGRAFTNVKARRAIEVDRLLASPHVPARIGCRRAGGQDTDRCMPPDMYICAAGCRIPHDENRILNAESRALARIRPDAAVFPVRRAYEVKKIRKRKMQQPYSRFTPAAYMKPALIYEGGLAAVRAGLPLRRWACRRADICAVL